MFICIYFFLSSGNIQNFYISFWKFKYIEIIKRQIKFAKKLNLEALVKKPFFLRGILSILLTVLLMKQNYN